MAKILSQDEIDALLTTVSTGEADTAEAINYDDEKLRSVVAYDFKHPNRVSKDQIRTLENMHDNFAGHFGSALSTVLRTIADVDLVSVDQITYSEFIMSLVTPSCTYTFAAPPLDLGYPARLDIFDPRGRLCAPSRRSFCPRPRAKGQGHLACLRALDSVSRRRCRLVVAQSCRQRSGWHPGRGRGQK